MLYLIKSTKLNVFKNYLPSIRFAQTLYKLINYCKSAFYLVNLMPSEQLHVWLPDHIWPWKYSQLWPRENRFQTAVFSGRIQKYFKKLWSSLRMFLSIFYSVSKSTLMQNLPNLYSSKINTFNFNYLYGIEIFAYLHIAFSPWENKQFCKIPISPTVFLALGIRFWASIHLLILLQC